jgi:hypothetical protein
MIHLLCVLLQHQDFVLKVLLEIILRFQHSWCWSRWQHVCKIFNSRWVHLMLWLLPLRHPVQVHFFFQKTRHPVQIHFSCVGADCAVWWEIMSLKTTVCAVFQLLNIDCYWIWQTDCCWTWQTTWWSKYPIKRHILNQGQTNLLTSKTHTSMCHTGLICAWWWGETVSQKWRK